MSIDSYINFSKMDSVVKDAILQFLPRETLGKSAATSKLFHAIMNNRNTWMKMAKKLNITPKSSDSAKNEVISRLIGNAALAKDTMSSEEIQSCKDPFKLNNLIQADTHSPNKRWLLQDQLVYILAGYNTSFDEKDGPNQTNIDAALFLLKEGVMQDASIGAWDRIFYHVLGFVGATIEQYIYPKAHVLLFQTLVEEMMKSTTLTVVEKQELMKKHHGHTFAFKEKANYPYTFMEIMIKAGWHPTYEDIYEVYERCPVDLTKKAPLALRIKYSRLLLKNSTPEEKKQFLLGLFEKKLVLDAIRLEEYMKKVFSLHDIYLEEEVTTLATQIYQYIHWPEIEALILGKKTYSNMVKEISEREEQVLNMIEKNKPQIGKFVDYLKQAAHL